MCARNGFAWLRARDDSFQQPLRNPPQASVNVVMHEDLPRMQEEAKYRGMLVWRERRHCN